MSNGGLTQRRWRRATALFLIALATSSLVEANNPHVYGVGMSAARLFDDNREGNLERLDGLITKYADSSQRLPDGSWMLSGVAAGFYYRFGVSAGGNNSPTYARIQNWKAKYPQSTGAAIVGAIFWIAEARNASGSRYAPKPSNAARHLSREHFARAERVLIESQAYASSNPLWYLLYMEVARGLDSTSAKFQQLFDEATRKTPGFYPYYSAVVGTLLPRNGGSYEAVDRFIAKAVEATRAEKGAGMYARLYSDLDAAEPAEFDFFKATHASWGIMKASFEEIRLVYPKDSWTLNVYLSFACRAGDKSTYARLRQELGAGRYNQDAWRSNYSRTVCDEMHLVKT